MRRYEIPSPSPEDIAFGKGGIDVSPVDSSSPEGRIIVAERVTDFLRKSGILEILHDEESKKQWLETVSAKEFLQLLKRLNGLIQGLDIKKREVDPHTSNTIINTDTGVTAYDPPRPLLSAAIFKNDLLPLMRELSLDDAATFLAGEINLMHLFADGNGRLSRIMYLLLLESKVPSRPEAREALIIDAICGRYNTYDWNPAIILEDLDEILRLNIVRGNEHLRDIVMTNGIPEKCPHINSEDFEMWLDIEKNDPEDFLLGAMLHFGEKDDIGRYVKNDPEGWAVLDTRALFEGLKQEEVPELLASYEAIKGRRLILFGDIYKEPDKFKSRNPKLNLKKYFESRVVNIHRKVQKDKGSFKFV